jgi:hypothetical protein
MHPIERLRFIAQAEDEPVAAVAAEAAFSLAELAGSEPAAALMAARRLVEHHPTAGPLYWACACVLGAEDPYSEASAVEAALSSDRTARHLSSLLRERFGEGSVLVASPPLEVLGEALDLDSGGHVVRVVSEQESLRHEVRSLGRVADEVVGYTPQEAAEALAGASVLLVEALVAGSAVVVLSRPAAALVDGAAAAGVPAVLLVAQGRVLSAQLAGPAAEAAVESGLAEVMSPDRFALAVGHGGIGGAIAAVASFTCPPGDWLTVGRR